MKFAASRAARGSTRVRPTAALAALLLTMQPIAWADSDWKALAALQQSGARVSAAAFDLTDRQPMPDLHGDVRLTPASLTKLVVAAAALEQWPSNKSFRTRVLATAPIADGTIAGDLVLVGAGDPSLTGADLWTLAAQLKAAGVSRVNGRVVVRPAPWRSVPCETKDRCEAAERSDTAYNAPLASIGVDYGTWCIDVRGRVAGTSATVSGCSVAVLPIEVVGTVATVATGETQLWAERRTTAGGVDRIHVGGRLPEGATQRFYRAMSRPELGAGLLFAQTLREIGIELAGNVRVTHVPGPAGAGFEIAVYEGLPLKEQLGRMLRFSNNYIADVLTLTTAASVAPEPPLTLAEASTRLADVVARSRGTVERRSAIAPDIRSGSGLTPENRLSAEDLVALLARAYGDTRNFGSFYGGLVVPREAPFAFLRTGSPRWLDRVALKTGTMSEPDSVCGVAGYLRRRDGGWVAFAAIVNGDAENHRRIPLHTSMAAIRTDVDALLARY
jgi:D-alanyl-D-alanine carboxypeptidase/D-alanyl-D-alanine-endopeptidase (penicillin-binding protein 4)